MRTFALLLCSTLAFSQTSGKPGVTDPIKDPRQIPGHENPGPIPRATPQPKPPVEAREKKTKKKKNEKTTRQPER